MCMGKDWFTLLCIVSGLDNFEVGVSDVFPTKGEPVSADSYTLCGRYSGSVDTSIEITINCVPFSRQFRYVIIRSSDATPEHLCLAEVAVYNESEYKQSRLHCCNSHAACTTCSLGLLGSTVLKNFCYDRESVCPSICLSVTSQNSTTMSKYITQTMPCDIPSMISVF